MKNNIFKIIMAAGMAIFVGCNDAIDIEQPGRLYSENAFLTIDDLESGLLGAYNNLDATYEIGFTAVLTDETYIGTENGGQNLDLLNFNMNSSAGWTAGIWLGNYAAIDMCNRILEASENIDSSDDPVAYNSILGQVYAIRAYSHFKILTYYSTDYTDDSALAGILRLTTTDDIFGTAARNTNAEFYAAINADLDMSESLLNEDLGNKYVSVDFLTAIRARMAAYREQYVLADQYASSLLASYPIADQAQYFNMFDDIDDTEVIFALERTISDSYDDQGIAGGGWAGSLFNFATTDEGAFMEMSRSVYNILAQNTADIRYSRNLNTGASVIDANYQTNNAFINDDVLIVYKYPGSETQPLMNDLKLFRSSEMLLIRAEAAADANLLGDVSILLKQLKDARYGSAQALVTYADQEDAFGAILDERRIELLFEGHRWVDLKRLGDRGNRSVDRDARECSFFSCTISNDDYRFTLPIPISETIANPEADQNPGY